MKKFGLFLMLVLTACMFTSSNNVQGKAISTSSSQIQASNPSYLPYIRKGQNISPTPTPTTPIPTPTAKPTPTIGPGQTIIINHNNTDITMIPSGWIETAKQKITWIFVHTSHGGQLITGAKYFSQYKNPPLYNFINRVGEAPLNFFIPAQTNPIALRMGDNNSWSYSADIFTAMIRQHITSSSYGPDDIPVFMFAFCGELSTMTPGQVQGYLDSMAWGEITYPEVTFVYITGHADNGANQVLNANNNMIRDYVSANNKILYDFNDFEVYQPDGTLPPGIPDDTCPWCQTWCDNHPGFCPDFSLMDYCDHTHPLQCLLKSQAMWWLSARLAGWNGQAP